MSNVNEPATCYVCAEERMIWAWTDRHGVAQCIKCGAPYVIFHYEKGEDGKERRVDMAPSPYIESEAAVGHMKACFAATGRPMSARIFSLSFPGGQDAASADDDAVVIDWLTKNPWPQEQEQTDAE